jgi:hypothetical protein
VTAHRANNFWRPADWQCERGLQDLLTRILKTVQEGRNDRDERRYAKDVISERYTRLAWLEQVLNSPELVEIDPTDPELTHHVGRIKEHGSRALHSVFNNSARPVRIVTVYFDRKLKDRL